MKQLLYKLFLIATLSIQCFADTLSIDIKSKSNDFRNIRVLRVIDLTSSIVKESIGIHTKNNGSKAQSIYYYTIPSIYRPHLSSYQAYLKQGQKNALDMESMGLDIAKQVQVFKIHLNTSLEPESDIKIGIDLIYTHLIRPLPEKIPQVSRQHVSFASNIYLFSAYSTDDMKSTYEFPNTNIVTFVGGEPDRVGQKTQHRITYGAYKNIPPLSVGPGNFHYEYGSPILTVTQLKREVEISHWAANLAVTEDYALTHNGAKLIHDFSRNQYQLAPHILERTNVLSSLIFTLPQHAKNVYYRDEVGNVSTSHFRTETKNSILEIKPRFPLFGGWKTTWNIGYDVTLKDYLRYFKGEYILKVQFIENAQDMAFDNVQLKVILPEGATNVKITPPTSFKMDLIEQKTHYTYFDSIGRPAVIFYKGNAVGAHGQPIMISYKYPFFKLFRKPLVATAFIFVLCLTSIFISKVPWSLNELDDDVVEHDYTLTQPHFYVKGAVLEEDIPVVKPKVPLHAESAKSSSVKVASIKRKKNNKK